MSVMKGADVEQLRRLAKQVEQQARALSQIREGLNQPIDQMAWKGPDAQQFKGEWRQTHSRAIIAASKALELVASILKANAKAQEDTSNEYGASATAVAAHTSANDLLGNTREQEAARIAKMTPEEWLYLSNDPNAPAWKRDIASRRLLVYANQHPRDAYALMGFDGSGLSFNEFEKQVEALMYSFNRAQDTAHQLPGKPAVQLLGFGKHGGALTAAVAFGDLDTASNVAVNVPGMNANVGAMDDPLNGGASLYKSAKEANQYKNYSVVTWLGYDTPEPVGPGTVLHGDSARSGSKELTSFLDGIVNSRESAGTPAPAVSVLAHSYGSTTAAEALKNVKHPVKDAIFYGSAGLEKGSSTSAGQAGYIKAQNHYYTESPLDTWAGKGRAGSGRVNPKDIPGFKSFPSSDIHSERYVNKHDMYSEPVVDSGICDPREDAKIKVVPRVGYLTEGTNSVKTMGIYIAR